jgi:hypothetical protein
MRHDSTGHGVPEPRAPSPAARPHPQRQAVRPIDCGHERSQDEELEPAKDDTTAPDGEQPHPTR